MQLNDDITQVPYVTLNHVQQNAMNACVVPVNIDDYYSASEESGGEGKAMVTRKPPSRHKLPAWRDRRHKHKPSSAKPPAFIMTTTNADNDSDSEDLASEPVADRRDGECNVEMKEMSSVKGFSRRPVPVSVALKLVVA